MRFVILRMLSRADVVNTPSCAVTNNIIHTHLHTIVLSLEEAYCPSPSKKAPKPEYFLR